MLRRSKITGCFQRTALVLVSASILGLGLLSPVPEIRAQKSETDSSLFDRVNERLRSAPQTSIQFQHIVTSEFFGVSDTVEGMVTFTAGGLYVTALGNDTYTFDGECLWEYSALYAQATKNCLKAGQRIEDSFLFFRSFDSYYDISEQEPDSVYLLHIRSASKGLGPDSLTVTLDKVNERIAILEYLDINEELNQVLIKGQLQSESVDSSLFQANFPDSTEIIVIPG